MDLAERTCIPCRGGVPPMTPQQIAELLPHLQGWTVVDNHHLVKSYRFPDFASALEFVNRVGALAEEQNHHPDICLSWGKVDISLWTHKINGLSESDFVFAAKVDRIDPSRDRQAAS